MQKKLFRILSVFLAVVIISVSFMQPVAYANAAVIGGGALVLLVAGLLITCGMVFTSQSQAEAVATHTISQMPTQLLDTLAGFVGGGDPSNNYSKYSLQNAGFSAAVLVSTSAYIAFKAWFDEHFGVSEETFAGDAGGVSGELDLSEFGLTGIIITVTDSMGNQRTLPAYNYSAAYIESSYEPWFDFSFNGYDYRRDDDGNYINVVKYKDGNFIKIVRGLLTLSYIDVGFAFVFNDKGELCFSLCQRYWDLSFDRGWLWNAVLCDKLGYFYSDFQSDSKLALDAEAWEYFHDYENDTITYALASEIDEMFDKKYSEVVGDYSLDNWDYRKDLEALQGLYDGVCADLDRLKGYDALLEQSQALQRELDRVREEVAAQGADVIGGVGALDDAMYDAGLVLQGLRDMIAAQDRDATKIADLELELEKAKDAIRDLTRDTDIDIPVNPPITEGAKGKINWNVLLNIAIFDKFPFSIPKDIYSFFDALSATPIEPVFVFDIFGGKFGPDAVIVIDFKAFEDIRRLVRNGMFIIFVIGLIAVTKKYIWK